ncbi:sulfatase [Aestuariivivens sediminis]|uniref:sulfatase n=1 Tax=Aestuariivivens sediminis TaxID=2913557 RepID=UPI001F5A51FC|nr:sulfatase [Aestuariivivens sediminis]
MKNLKTELLHKCAFTCTCLWLAFGLLSHAQGAPRPNVLFIAADDLNTDMGSYGVDQVQTPHLDRLAKMGVRFDNAHAQYPVCGPSRASLMTGLRPNTTGFLSNRDQLRERVPDVVTLGQYFQNQGYYSGRVGKIFHYGNPGSIGTDGADDVLSWTERFNPAGIDKMQEENIIRFPGGRTGKKGGLGISMAYWDPVSQDSEHTDGMVADRAVEMIERNKDKPFFIAAGFFNPHCPYVAPRTYFDMYPIEEITLPDLEAAKRDLEDVPAMALLGEKSWPYYFKGMTTEEALKCKQAYYACVSFVDAQVGKLLDTLEKHNLLENTIVIFWSDHGYFLGEKGLWFKHKNFERSTKVPLIIAGHGVDARGKAVSEPVELLDLYPTLVDLLGHQIPDVLEGESLIPFLKNANHKWEKPAISQVYRGPDAQGYSIRTRQWRFTEWNGGKDGYELYNHENDPGEVVNLAHNRAYLKIREQLKTQLKPYVKYN